MVKPKAAIIFSLIVISLSVITIALVLSAQSADPDAHPAKTSLSATETSLPAVRLRNEFFVKYKEDFIKRSSASERQIVVDKLGKELSSQFGVRILSTMPNLGIHRMKILDEHRLAEVISQLAKHPAVELVRSGQSIRPSPEVLEDEVLVKYKGIPPNDSPQQRQLEVEKLGKELGSKFGVRIRSTNWKLGMQRMKIPAGKPLATVIANLAEHSAVDIVEPIYVGYASGYGDPQSAPPSETVWTNGDLWGMNAVGMKKLWDYGIIGNNKIVAVIDSGIDYTHADWIQPDGSKNLWTDASGNFGHNYCDDNDDPMDVDGHGTAVAGIIGAVGNNSSDLSGVNWKVKLMALKALCGSRLTINSSDAADAVQYAVDHGAWVINTSWHIDGYSAGLETAIKYAMDHDVLLVASASNKLNDNDFWPTYPANYALENVIAVAATNIRDQLWIGQGSSRYGSNWGETTVHIAAPGDYIYSLQTTKGTGGGGTSGWDGTSMAAPLVAGCAALMERNLSVPANPKTIKDRIMSHSDPVSCLEGFVINAKRLNCYKAVTGKYWYNRFGTQWDYYYDYLFGS